MRVIHTGMMLSIAAAALLSTACASEESASTTRRPMSQEREMKAPGATQTSTDRQPSTDGLKECLARIPKDASAWQRSSVEQSCKRDYGTERAGAQADPRAAFASGTQGDTLQNCENRIPRDATAGQRMMAELSCQRDETNRREVDVVPGNR